MRIHLDIHLPFWIWCLTTFWNRNNGMRRKKYLYLNYYSVGHDHVYWIRSTDCCDTWFHFNVMLWGKPSRLKHGQWKISMKALNFSLDYRILGTFLPATSVFFLLLLLLLYSILAPLKWLLAVSLILISSVPMLPRSSSIWGLGHWCAIPPRSAWVQKWLAVALDRVGSGQGPSDLRLVTHSYFLDVSASLPWLTLSFGPRKFESTSLIPLSLAAA